jgi:MFS transporter, Spinster family, sphingosine-1-phosphate transporter
VAYMVLSPLFARAGDFMRRWWLVGIGVTLWSLASGSSGLSTGLGFISAYTMLLLTRCFVGVGEAAYGPIAPAMLSDLYPASMRGKIMAWFYVAIPVGSALGFVIGGQLAEHFGWRHAFWVTYIGLVPAVLCFFFRDPPRSVEAKPSAGQSYLAVLKEVSRIPSFLLICAGMTASTFVLGGVAVWVPEYIFQREAKFVLTDATFTKLATDKEYRTLDGETRLVPETITDKLKPAASDTAMSYREWEKVLTDRLTKEELVQHAEMLNEAATAKDSISLGKIGIVFGGITVIGGLAATILGGLLGDWLRNRGVRGAYFHVAGWSTLAGFPLFVAFLYTPFPAAWVLLFFLIFCLFANTGPANTVVANVVRSPIRATGFAINIFVIHALGDAISPPIIGFVADQSNLHTAFLATSAFIVLAGGLWVWGAKYLDEDTRKAELS